MNGGAIINNGLLLVQFYKSSLSLAEFWAHASYTIILLPNDTLHLVRHLLCTSGLITSLPDFYTLRRINLIQKTKYVLESCPSTVQQETATEAQQNEDLC